MDFAGKGSAQLAQRAPNKAQNAPKKGSRSRHTHSEIQKGGFA